MIDDYLRALVTMAWSPWFSGCGGCGKELGWPKPELVGQVDGDESWLCADCLAEAARQHIIEVTEKLVNRVQAWLRDQLDASEYENQVMEVALMTLARSADNPALPPELRAELERTLADLLPESFYDPPLPADHPALHPPNLALER